MKGSTFKFFAASAGDHCSIQIGKPTYREWPYLAKNDAMGTGTVRGAQIQKTFIFCVAPYQKPLRAKLLAPSGRAPRRAGLLVDRYVGAHCKVIAHFVAPITRCSAQRSLQR